MKISKIAILVCVLTLGLDCGAAENKTMFKLFACLDWPEGMTLVFKDDSGRARYVAFGDGDKEFALEWPTGKGLLKWRDTIAIHVVPSGDGRHLMTIEYRDDRNGSIHVFEAGLIDNACLSKIRGRYGASFKFDDQAVIPGESVTNRRKFPRSIA
jgi:hypothetical protein